MISVLMALYVAVLFYVLAPGILLSLPRGGNKMTVAMTHALVAAVVFYFTHKMAYKFLRQFDGFQDAAMNMGANATAPPMVKREGFQKKNVTV
jgi:hypothetical protein